ncbi:MAG TPA: deoxyribonuclease IV [Candidatus Pacearchaeota archaeon]|nr:deoxyribonuclease IV [Candidatus Pacearchaeota archaeon]
MAQIGAHVSVTGGLVNGLIRAEELGIDTIQIFGSSPRQWSVHFPDQSSLDNYHRYQQKRLVEPVFLHAPYLINLATEKQELWQKSVEALAGHLSIAEQIKARGLVFHIGSSGGVKEKVLARVVRGMEEVLARVPGSVQLIVENSAGGGQKVGVNPIELGFLIGHVNSDRVGACLDTAHAFQSGLLDLHPDRIDRYLANWDDKLGLEHLRLLHVNDSLTEFNSGRDLHANIGQGKMGLEGFQALAQRAPLNGLPWILETPGFDGQGPDLENVKRLRSCFG